MSRSLGSSQLLVYTYLYHHSNNTAVMRCLSVCLSLTRLRPAGQGLADSVLSSQRPARPGPAQ